MWKVIGPLFVFVILIVFVILFLPENSIISSDDIVLNSTAFLDGGEIPAKYTCDGENINPPLQFSGLPGSTKSLVIIMYDESTEKEFSHWVLFNVKPTLKEIKMNTNEGRLGFNDFNEKGYSGPCPPPGDSAHTYVIKVYATNTVPIFSPTSPITRSVVEDKIDGRVVGSATLKGTYARA
jgi:Raf kinase inhibitor-like YbhB/YbcL family protein